MKIATIKRVYSFLLACVMVLAMLPATSLAADKTDPNYCPHCDDIATWTEITTIGSTPATGHYRLTQDYTAGGVRTIGKAADVVIDLAGSDITAKTNTRLFAVYGGLSILDTSAGKTGELIASDISSKSSTDGYGACVYLSKTGDYGTFNLYGGTIRGGRASRGGNIYIVNGEANIYNGTVKDGYASSMGGNICLYTDNSRLNVYGGTITQTDAQTAVKNFGNITNYDGVVNVYDGTISDTRTGAKSIHSSGTTSEFNVYGGTLTSSIGWHGVVGVKIYNGVISGQDPTDYKATTGTCVYNNNGTYTVWQPDLENCTFKNEIKNPVTGKHTYVDGECACGAEHCPHCEGSVKWQDISDLSTAMIASGHYRLTAEVTLSGTRTIGATADVVIDLNGSNITAADGKRAFTVYGKLTIIDSSANQTGHIYGKDISANGDKVAGYGACVYGGEGSVFNLYGGTITDGKAIRGGNIYVGGAANIYGGTVTNGSANYGENLYAGNSKPAEVYGGTFGPGQDSAVADLVGDGISIFNGNTAGDPSGFLAACAEYCKTNGVYVIWHAMPNPCKNTECKYGANLSEITPNSAVAHSIPSGSTTCANCNTVVAKVGTVSYTKLEDALNAATAGSTVTMTGNCTASNIDVTDEVTLDLAGNILVANAVDASLGNIIDSANGEGLLICPQNSSSVTFNGTNKHLPIRTTDGYRFTAVTFKQRIYGAEDGIIKFKFYFNETADETILAEILENGSEDTNLSVKLRLSWIRNGVENEETYVIESKDVAKYAESWDTSVFVLTVSGLDGVTSLTCTPVVVSTPIDGLQTEVAISGVAAQGVMAEVKNPLTWGEISQFDTARENLIKTMGTMTEEDRIAALRQHCVDFAQFTKQALWTPKSDRYFNLDSKTPDSLDVGTVYGGLPYVSNATGNLYRLLDYIDENGVLDTEAATQSMLQFGTMCSSGVYAGWGRVINSAKTFWTKNITKENGFLPLGWDSDRFNIGERWTADCTTHDVVEEYGWSGMVEAYALLQPGDGCVYIDAADDNDAGGHVLMIVDVHKVRNTATGNIDGNASYVTIVEQTKTWTEGTKTGANGTDTYLYKDLDTTLTFNQLYMRGYVPFTFAEFLPSSDPRHQAVEETTCTITPPSGKSLDKDVITTNDFWGATVEANYGILDIYVTITDPNTNKELYWYAYRLPNLDAREQKIYPTSGNVVTRGAIPTYTGETQYPIKIEVQLSTGERPVLYEGLLQR